MEMLLRNLKTSENKTSDSKNRGGLEHYCMVLVDANLSDLNPDEVLRALDSMNLPPDAKPAMVLLASPVHVRVAEPKAWHVLRKEVLKQ